MTPAFAASPPYQHIGTVNDFNGSTTPPDRFISFDISWVDNATNTYYLADRANNGLDAVDADDGSLKAIPVVGKGLFSGNYNDPANADNPCALPGRDTRNGPNGVWTDDNGLVYAGDGNHATGSCNPVTKDVPTGTSTLKILDPNTNTLLANIDNGGVRRADEGAFGRKRNGGGRTLVANPEEDSVPGHHPFVSLIDTDSRTLIGKIAYDEPASVSPLPAGHAYNADGFGLEQAVWDPGKQAFALNVPGTVAFPGGEIDVISPDTSGGNGRVLQIFGLLDTCGGAGLAISGGEWIVACSNDVRILNHNNGQEIARFADGGGADEIWFNPGDRNVYLGLTTATSSRPNGIGILNVPSRTFLGVVNQGVPANGGTHSVAAERKTNRIFLPVNNGNQATLGAAGNGMGGVAMYQKDDSEPTSNPAAAADD
jgi:hypothetical protein